MDYAAMARSNVWPAWGLLTVPLDYLHCRRPAVGWIGAGDATLGVQKVRAAWQRSFQPFREQISTLLLPHHGSGRELSLRLARLAQPKPLRRCSRRSFSVQTPLTPRGPGSRESRARHASGVAAPPVGTARGIPIAVLMHMQAKDPANWSCQFACTVSPPAPQPIRRFTSMCLRIGNAVMEGKEPPYLVEITRYSWLRGQDSNLPPSG